MGMEYVKTRNESTGVAAIEPGATAITKSNPTTGT
jgi:hypothetical protein